MAEEAEEKRLPASEKKLRDAHRRGQVSQSKDLVAAFTLAAALLYVYFAWPTVLGHVEGLVDTVSAPIGPDGAGFAELAPRAIRQAGIVLLMITVPLVAVVFLCTAIFGMMATHGPVFSAETIKPNVQHINPAEGLKKIFSRRNVVEFAKGIAKVVVLGIVFTVVVMLWLQPLFLTPACGDACVEPTLVAMLIPLAASAGLAFIVIGVLDMPIQRWLFLQEMRMTTTEYRREQKDMEGDPLIRQALQRQRREAVLSPQRLGLKNAVLVFTSTDLAVGVRYVKGETPIPVVVAKGRGKVAREMQLQAGEMGKTVIEEPALAEAIFETSRTGDFIGEGQFPPVVRHLVRLGLT